MHERFAGFTGLACERSADGLPGFAVTEAAAGTAADFSAWLRPVVPVAGASSAPVIDFDAFIRPVLPIEGMLFPAAALGLDEGVMRPTMPVTGPVPAGSAFDIASRTFACVAVAMLAHFVPVGHGALKTAFDGASFAVASALLARAAFRVAPLDAFAAASIATGIVGALAAAAFVVDWAVRPG